MLPLCHPASSSLGRGDPLGLRLRPDLLGNPTPAHLAVLFGPPLLFVLGVVFTAAVRAGARAPAEPRSPGLTRRPGNPPQQELPLPRLAPRHLGHGSWRPGCPE